MRIEIKADRLDTVTELNHFAIYCAGFELGPQRDKVVSVQIHLAQASELRAGKDQLCFVQIELFDNHKIITKAMDLDWHVAIYRALERAGWMVAHRQQRKDRLAASVPLTQRQVDSTGAPNWAA